MNGIERAQAVLEVLQKMRSIRRGTLAYQGWSWRAAGYHYDPEQRELNELDALAKRLDALLDGLTVLASDR